MGLFSLKKTVTVSSVIYNMAGAEDKRNNYLKSTVIGSILNGDDSSQTLSEDLTNSYLNGPGLNFRRYADWVQSSGYNSMLGMTSGKLYLSNTIDSAVLVSQIPAPLGSSVVLQMSELGFADFSWWADQYVTENYPDRLNTDYESDMDEEANIISIKWADDSVTSFTPVGFDDDNDYIYASYFLTSGDVVGPIVPGVPVVLDPTDPFLPTIDWTTVSTSTVPTTASLNTTVDTLVTYSDGRPDENSTTTTPSTKTYNVIDDRYSKSEFQGISFSGSSLVLTTLDSYRFDYQTGSVITLAPVVNTVSETLPDGTVKTTKTTTTAQDVQISRGYRIDTQEVVSGSSSAKIFIYGKGTGNADLDAMFQSTTSDGEYFPPIPVRVDNDMIDDSRFDPYFDQISKAYKKATRSKFSKFLSNIKENNDLGDIDYGYCSFGVSLNVQDQASRKYIYTFFQKQLESIGNDPAYAEFKVKLAIAQASQVDYNAWLAAQENPLDPLYGTKAPDYIPTPSLPTTSVQVRTSNLFNYNMIVSWTDLSEFTGSGVLDPTRKIGDIWITFGTDDTYDQVIINGSNEAAETSLTVEHMIINYQETATTWRTMNVWGCSHKNKIYKGKAVNISAKSAMNDTEESGFLIPLQKELYKSISLVDATQMSLACSYLVFNCYQVTKQKWYASSIFKVIVIIVIIVISIFFPPTAGLLGPAATVGAAVGLAGTAALIVGTIANMIAAMVLMSVIGKVSTAVFGDKIGSIVGSIVSVIAIAYGTSASSGVGMTQSFSNLTEASNLIALSNSAGQGYAGYIQASAQETLQKTQDLLSEYSDKMKEISSAYKELYGEGSTGLIDPLWFTDAAGINGTESLDSFLDRTLMTGSDIANMSIILIERFASITTDPTISME